MELSNILNRPSELYQLRHYGELPEVDVEIGIAPSIGQLLALDLFTLDGVQPIEKRHALANDGLLYTNPSSQSIELFREENIQFQIVFVVVNCYRFEETDGGLIGKPYNVSLQPASKRGLVETVSVDWLARADLKLLGEANRIYKGFNPFAGAYGMFMMGFSDYSHIESDMIGFVHGMYVLAVPFKHEEVLSPAFGPLTDHSQVRRDYQKYRKKRYFEPFRKVKPRRVWGCDSPIELFLLQALGELGMEPEVQTIICDDGFTTPHLFGLWENQKSRRRVNVITEADFFFPEQRLAVFCDSRAHHSSPEAKQKDAAIDDALREIGIRSLRVFGPDIANSPFASARKVAEGIEACA